MQKRLFLGIPVPSPIPIYLEASLQPLKVTFPDWKWVQPDNYHITISFFGSIDDEEIPHLIAIVEPTLSQINPFTISIDSLVFAPPDNDSRMLWAINKHDKDFSKLVSSIESAVISCFTLPNYRKDHKPIPHITLARFEPKSINKGDLQLPTIHNSITVQSCVLFESILTSGNPHYVRYKDFNLHS